VSEQLLLNRARQRAKRDQLARDARRASTEDLAPVPVSLSDLSASTFSRQYVAGFHRPRRLVAASLRSADAIASSGSNYWVLILRNVRRGVFGSVYRDLVLSDEPTRYWPLDQQSGGTTTDMCGVADLTHTSVTSAAAGPPGVDLEQACSYDGSASYSSMASANLDLDGAMAMECWVYVDDVSTRQTILGCENATNQPMLEVGQLGAGRIKVITSAGDVVSVAAGQGLRAADWNHILYTRSGANGDNMYVNGVYITSKTVTSRTFDDAAAVRTIGRRASASQLLTGKVAHHAIYGGKQLGQLDAQKRYGTILQKTTYNGRVGEAITADVLWTWDVATLVEHNMELHPGDRLYFEAHPVGSPGALTGLRLDIVTEPV
jgi:hypothetical protein